MDKLPFVTPLLSAFNSVRVIGFPRIGIFENKSPRQGRKHCLGPVCTHSICPLVLPVETVERRQCAAISGSNANGFDVRVNIVVDEHEDDEGAVTKADNVRRFLITNWT